MENIILYTTHCPKCNILEKKMKSNGINFVLNDTFDIKEMINKGFLSAPIVEIDGELMDFNKANAIINEKIKVIKGGQ